MSSAAPIILVPGFWLGAWAWDEVAAALRADGHDVTALTLPGLQSVDADRSSITVSDHIAAMVYVDTGAGKGAGDADFEAVELPMPSREQLAAEESLDGLSDEQLETFERRAVPEPGGVLRNAHTFADDRRLDIPSTVICTGFTSEQYKEAATKGYPFLAGLEELRDVTYVDVPTSHWPMWSRPQELAAIIGDIVRNPKKGSDPIGV